MFLFDEYARRTREWEYRQLAPGRLHLRRYQERRHTSDAAEESPERGWRFTVTIDPDGRAERVLRDVDGPSAIGVSVPVEHRSVAKAEFGVWTAYVDARLLGLSDPIALVPAPVPVGGRNGCEHGARMVRPAADAPPQS